MPKIDGSTISTVLDVYQSERARLIEFLAALDKAQWVSPTECPAYSVKGIATHTSETISACSVVSVTAPCRASS